MALFARKFRKFLKFNKDNLKNYYNKFEKSKHDKAEKIPKLYSENLNTDESNRCHGCEGYGHRARECPTKLWREGKQPISFNATLSDNEKEKGPDSPIERNFIAFMASHVSDNEKLFEDAISNHDTSKAFVCESQ